MLMDTNALEERDAAELNNVMKKTLVLEDRTQRKYIRQLTRVLLRSWIEHVKIRNTIPFDLQVLCLLF